MNFGLMILVMLVPVLLIFYPFMRHLSRVMDRPFDTLIDVISAKNAPPSVEDAIESDADRLLREVSARGSMTAAEYKKLAATFGPDSRQWKIKL